MGLLSHLARGYLINRLLGHRRQPPGYPHGGYADPRYRSAGYPRQGGYGRPVSGQGHRGRFRLLPIPHYSRRTRSGARVSVGGCCLPIPLFVVAGSTTSTWLAVRALRRR